MKNKKVLIIAIIVVALLIGGAIYLIGGGKSPDNGSTNEPNASTSDISDASSASENITKEQAEEILNDKFGTTDKETGYTISYDYMAKIKDENGNEYYAFRQTWLVNDHSSFLKNIFISLDGKDIKTSELSIGYEDGQTVNFADIGSVG